MVDEQGGERKGAQQDGPAEREAKKHPSEKQDLEKPPEGRDEAPAETVEQGKRDPKSPWMGGGYRLAIGESVDDCASSFTVYFNFKWGTRPHHLTYSGRLQTLRAIGCPADYSQ